MHRNSSSVGPKGQAVTVKPKAGVRIGWQWDAVYTDIREKISDETHAMQLTFDPHELQLGPLQSVFATLFNYTTDIAAAGLIFCEVEVFRFAQEVGAHLRELDSVKDEFLLQVCPHPNVVIKLRISLAPAQSLVRSRQKLLDAMADVKKLFSAEAMKQEDRHAREARERREKRERAVVACLDKAPGAAPEDIVLLVIEGIAKTSRNHRVIFSTTAIKEILRRIRPEEFPTKEKEDEALAGLVKKRFLEHTVLRGNQDSFRLLQPGRERVATLLS